MAEAEERSPSSWPKPPDTRDAVIELVSEIARHVYQPGRSFKYSTRKNGFRKPRRSLSSTELRRLISLMKEYDLPRNFRLNSGNPELVVYCIKEGEEVELIRLTALHLPRANMQQTRKFLNHQAASLFRSLYEHEDNIQLLRQLGILVEEN